MSNEVILLATRRVVRTIGKDYVLTPLSYSLRGTLMKFKIGDANENEDNTFIYIEPSDFYKGDAGKEGYCMVSAFKKYRNRDKEFTFQAVKESKYWFDLQFENAKIGDIFRIESVYFVSPYTAYYKRAKYAFKIKDVSINFLNPAAYPQTINTDINSPNYNIKDDLSLDLLTTPTGNFYTKNFGIKVTAWTTIPDAEKERFALVMTKICFKIYWIVKEVLETIAINSIDNIKSAIVSNTISTYPKIDQLVGQLLITWGYLSGNGFPAVDILTVNSVQDYNQYYNALINFHSSFILKDESFVFPPTNPPLTQEQDSERRITRIIKLLHPIALAALPMTERLKLLDHFMRKDEIEEDSEDEINEGDILKILKSVTGSVEADQLLDFLLIIRDGKRTNFEVLYYLMDDEGLDRYAFIQWFVSEQPNRKFFTFLLYEIWKISRYNFYHIPTGVTPNEDGMNPNAFFLTPTGNNYYAKYDANGNVVSGTEPILEFSTQRDETPGTIYYDVLYTGVKYEPLDELDKEKIIINKISSETYSYYSPYGGGYNTLNSESLYGNYHIYQPISLIGFKADLDLVIPEFTAIPAFLFFYAVEYDKLKEYDALISFGIEVIAEVGLFFLTGGAGALRHLRHLKHITKINDVRRGVLAAEEAILFWRGIESGTQVTSVTAGVFTSFFNYQATITNDPARAALNRKLSLFFLGLTFASAGAAIYSRHRAVKSAKEVLSEIDELSNSGIPHNVPDDVLDVVFTVRNTAAASLTLFRNRVTSLPASELGESNHIADIFNNVFTDAQRDTFWKHFGDKIADTPTNNAFWKAMNKTENTISAARIKAWKDAPEKFKLARRQLGFLDEVVKLSITDRKAYEHLAEFANRPRPGALATSSNITGGHKFNLILNGSSAHKIVDNGIEILDPNFTHTITGATSPKMIDYLNNVGSVVYSKIPKPGGHFVHKNILIKKLNQPTTTDLTNGFVLDGITYEKKALQTQLNPIWQEADIIHEFAYAAFKKRVTGNPSISAPQYGRSSPLVETSYISNLIDGTSVSIKHVTYHRYNLQPVFDDHYHYFVLNF